MKREVEPGWVGDVAWVGWGLVVRVELDGGVWCMVVL